MPPADLSQILQRLVGQYGSLRALGDALGISPSRMSRVTRGEQGSLEVVNCLKIADVSGLDPSVVLRAADKADVADLIERVYAREGRAVAMPPLPPDQRELITLWIALPPEAQEEALRAVRFLYNVTAEIRHLSAVVQQAQSELREVTRARHEAAAALDQAQREGHGRAPRSAAVLSTPSVRVPKRQKQTGEG